MMMRGVRSWPVAYMDMFPWKSLSNSSVLTWYVFIQVVQHVVADRFAVFEKNIEDLGTRMLKIEKAIKQQVGRVPASMYTYVLCV